MLPEARIYANWAPPTTASLREARSRAGETAWPARAHRGGRGTRRGSRLPALVFQDDAVADLVLAQPRQGRVGFGHRHPLNLRGDAVAGREGQHLPNDLAATDIAAGDRPLAGDEERGRE